MSENLLSLVDELKIPGIGSDVDLSFISRYNLENIWGYLAENVKSNEKSQLIHKNLAVLKYQQSWSGSRGEGDASTDSCSEKRTIYRQLLLKVQQQQKHTSQLESSVSNHQKSLTSTAQQSRCARLSSEDTAAKLHLLVQHAESVRQEIRILKQFQHRIQSELDKYSYLKFQGGGAGVSDEASKHLSQLRHVHSMITEMLAQLLSGHVNKSTILEDHRKIKKRLLLLHSCMTSSDLLSSLIHEATSNSDKIQQLIDGIDPVAEAKELGFCVMASGLVDESNDSPLSVSVAQMISERQLEHQKMFLQTQVLRSETKHCKSHAEACRQDLLKIMELSPQSFLLREVVEQSVEEKKAQSALELLCNVTQQLELQISASSDHLASLKRKHSMINSFRSDVQSKQNQIRVLLKQNSGSQAKLNERKAALLSTLNKLADSDNPVAALSSSVIQSSLTGEVRRLHTIPLYSLSPRPHSIIYNLDYMRGKSKPQIDVICLQLNHKSYQLADVWIASLLRMNTDILCSYSRPPTITDISYSHTQVEEIMALIEQSKISTSQLLRSLMPVADKAIVEVKAGIEKCDHVDKIVENWWNQPGLHIVMNN